MRFIQIDRVEELSPYESIRAIKCVTLADEVFNEHFPGQPIYPGSLVFESMAQTGGMLMMASDLKTGTPLRQCAVLMANRLKFKKFVLPGDRLSITAKLQSRLDSSFIVEAKVEVDGELKATGELTFGLGEVLGDRMRLKILDLFMPCLSGVV